MKRADEIKIAGLLKQWAKLRLQKERIETDRDTAIQPHKQRFDLKCAPIHQKANAKLNPLNSQMSALEQQVENLMLHTLEEDGSFSFRHIDAATAVAEVTTSSQRELDSKLFFDSVPPSQRTTAFWSCLKTMIGQAEKFLGETRLNELANAKLRHSVSIRAKE